MNQFTSTELQSKSAKLDPIFENHLAFLSTHRGLVSYGPEWVQLDGFAPFLSFWSPSNDTAPLPSSSYAVWCMPWSGDSWPRRLQKLGYTADESLAYMELAEPLPAPSAALPEDAEIRLVSSDEEALEFASVQAAGFLETDTPHRHWWTRCFEEMAIANWRRPNQSFFVAYRRDRAVAVLLCVRTLLATGIYAVATDPEYRRLGLSAALLRRAREEAIAQGATPLVLQATIGQYAHGFYNRLGFVDRYASQVWRTS